MALARFLQISDLHLGRPLGWLPADRREERRRDQRRALERAVTEAIERGVHALLVPGDLFDQEGVDADTLAFALSAFQVTGCPPVFIAPGNHDPHSPTSLYWDPRRLRARGMAWPAHVHVFTSARWSSAPVPGLAGVRVWGRCFISGVPSLERPLAVESLQDVSGADGNGFDIALFHGSREGYLPQGQKMTGPFSDAEALHAPFAYLAVGHYHAASRLTASQGASAGVRLAYAGSAVAQDVTETGNHGALEVRIEYEQRLPFVETEFIELDSRRVYDLTVDVGGSSSAERIDQRIVRALDDQAVGSNDLATVRLTGRIARGVRWATPPPDLRARVFHLRVDLRRVRPDHDLELYRAHDAATTEERFARALLSELDRESDPEVRARIESALYYGLDAFRLHEVVPAYEEIEEPGEVRT
jgi:DNA repair exonuclease SbcCD nuclease subunit